MSAQRPPRCPWAAAVAAALLVLGTRLAAADLGVAPVASAARWYDPDQAPPEGGLAGRAHLIWCGAVRPDALPEDAPGPDDVLQILEEVRPSSGSGRSYSVALFDELEEFVPRPGHRYSQLETTVLGGSYVVAAGRDPRRWTDAAGRRSSLREHLNARFAVWRDLRPGDGIYLVVDGAGRIRRIGAIDDDPRVLRRITAAELEAVLDAVAAEPPPVVETTVWEETATHRVKIRLRGGREVRRWSFRKKH